MKLFEVMYPKCKRCGFEFSKGGRDHRFGVCDVCAFPNSEKAKRAKIKEGMQHDAFHDQVEEVLWHEYQIDALMPAGETYPAEMDDEDYLEFGEHVDAIVKMARKMHIQNAKVAVLTYNAKLDRELQAAYASPRH